MAAQNRVYDVAPALQPISFSYFDRGVSDAVQPSITILFFILQGRCAWASARRSIRVSTWMRRLLEVLSHLESALIDLQLSLIHPTLHGIKSTNDHHLATFHPLDPPIVYLTTGSACVVPCQLFSHGKHRPSLCCPRRRWEGGGMDK